MRKDFDMKRLASIILAAGMTLSVLPVGAAELSVKGIIDPANKIIMINGSLNSGPDGAVSVLVMDSEKNTVFADELISGADGAFRTSLDVGGFADGTYSAKFKAEDSDEYEYNFTLPIKEDSIQPLEFSEGERFLLIKNGAPDEDYSQIVLNVKNAELVEGALDKSDFSAKGLPEGYELSGRVTDSKSIVFTLTGKGSVLTEHNVLIKVNSTVIGGGAANTDSQDVSVTIYPEEYAKTVNVAKYEFTAYMKNNTTVDADKSTFEEKIKIRTLTADGALKSGTDYELSVPETLSGIECALSANKEENKIQIRLSGTLSKELTKDEELSLILKSGCVAGADTDSAPIKITMKKYESQGSGGGSAGGGGSTGGGGYTGGGMTITDITPTVPEKKVSFADISGHWAENEILTLAGAGYVSGVGADLFVPNRSISRAEFVTMAVRAMKLASAVYNDEFADVLPTDWYAGYVAAALSAGIISQDSTFRPNDPIKREEMTKIIVNSWLLGNERPEWVNISQFADKEQISDWAADYVDLAVTLGLIKGDDKNNFNPKKSATRAEAAVMFYRLLYFN